MKKKMMKAIRDLNAYIDNDREELCDKIHDLELSHKRMERLLRSFVKLIKSFAYADNYDAKILALLVMRAEAELSNPYLRRNWGYQVKKEPGHYCDN